MAVEAMAVPKLLTAPGVLFLAQLGTARPTHVSAGGKFTDVWPAAWVRLGATAEGSDFSHGTEVEAITVAEFFAPVAQETVSQTTTWAFALASFTLSNFRRAMNGGVAAIAAAGVAGSEITSLKPTRPGLEVRSMLGWESVDGSTRFFGDQVLQGGEISVGLKKAPDYATIPCTWNFEVPASGDPWELVVAGTARV